MMKMTVGSWNNFPRFAALPAALLLVSAWIGGCNEAVKPDVMATVNGKQILKAELDRKYANYKQNVGPSPQQPSGDEEMGVRLSLLRNMIDEEILQQRAAKLNVAASDEDVNAKLTEMKAPFTTEEFQKKLKDVGESEDDLKNDIRHALTQNKLINKEIESKINITDAEIAGYYEAHKAEYNLIEPQYHLAQIVIAAVPLTRGPGAGRPVSDADAKRRAQDLHAKIKAGGDFSALAAQFSDDQNTASNGGDRGFVAESTLHTDAEAYGSISKLQPGQITDVMPIYAGGGPNGPRRAIGYAIYRLLDKQPAGQRALNDPTVQQVIRQGLRDRQAQLLRNAYYEMLRNDAKIHDYLADEVLREGAK